MNTQPTPESSRATRWLYALARAGYLWYPLFPAVARTTRTQEERR